MIFFSGRTECVKSVGIQSYSGPHFPLFGRICIRSISPYSVRMWENTDQNNSKYGHFLCNDEQEFFSFKVKYDRFRNRDEQTWHLISCPQDKNFVLYTQGKASTVEEHRCEYTLTYIGLFRCLPKICDGALFKNR